MAFHRMVEASQKDNFKRLGTFKMFPQKRHNIFVTKLAGDGYAYRDMNDDIICVSCKAVFKDWQSGWKGAHDAHTLWCSTKSKNEEVRGSAFSPTRESQNNGKDRKIVDHNNNISNFDRTLATALTMYGLGEQKEILASVEPQATDVQNTKETTRFDQVPIWINKQFLSEIDMIPDLLRLHQNPPPQTIQVFIATPEFDETDDGQVLEHLIIPMRSETLRYMSFSNIRRDFSAANIWPTKLSKDGFYFVQGDDVIVIKCFFCNCAPSEHHKAYCGRDRINVPFGRLDFPPVGSDDLFQTMGAKPRAMTIAGLQQGAPSAILPAPSRNLRHILEVDRPSLRPEEHQSAADETYNVGQEMVIRQPVGLQPRDQRGVVQYPEYSTRSSRLASFYRWPLTDAFHPRTLVELGFYYAPALGQADLIRCFCCGVEKRMQSWDQLVELALLHPEVNHVCAFHSARYSP